jgi:hypothetical protein
VPLPLAPGFRLRRLRLRERLLDRLGALVELGQEGPVEKLPEEKQEENEVDDLDQEGSVQIDEAPAPF